MDNSYDDVVAFSNRIREVVALIGNVSKVAKQTGVTPSSVNRWLKGESDPSRTNLIRLAEAAKVTIQWLATGEGEKMQGEPPVVSAPKALINDVVDVRGASVDVGEFVFIPRYRSPGQVRGEALSMAFRKSWVSHYVDADPQDLSVMEVTSDAMAGMVNKHDYVLLNHRKNQPDDGLYAIRIDKTVQVKRTQLMPDNRLKVTSSNGLYEPFFIELDRRPGYVEIMGKVEWAGGWL